MDLNPAITYVFKDRHWITKLGECLLFAVLCPVPVIGLIALCALLGYLSKIVHNVINDYPRPLPVWDHIGEDVNRGFHVLVALIVYNLPPAMLLILLYNFRSSIDVSLFGGFTYIGIVTALQPLLLLYVLFAWSMVAIGLVRYAETWDRSEFYSFGMILRTMQNNAALTLQWLIISLAANIVLLCLAPLLFLGIALFFPVQGHLAGSFGRRLRAAKMAYRQGRA